MKTTTLFPLVCMALPGFAIASDAPSPAAANQASPSHGGARPNIIIILTDDQGYGDLSCMYARDMRTPNIDKLFSEGVRMDNFYANASLCSPSRASLLTGRHCDMVGVQGVIRNEGPDAYYNNFGYLTPGVTMLPEVLKANGYTTAASTSSRVFWAECWTTIIHTPAWVSTR